MDDLDRKLLAALAADSSLSTSTLARDLRMARSTVQARIEKLERSGIIAGYTIRLGDVPGHRRIRATVLLQIEPRATPSVLQRLKPMPEVESCQTTSGRVDPDPVAISGKHGSARCSPGSDWRDSRGKKLREPYSSFDEIRPAGMITPGWAQSV